MEHETMKQWNMFLMRKYFHWFIGFVYMLWFVIMASCHHYHQTWKVKTESWALRATIHNTTCRRRQDKKNITRRNSLLFFCFCSTLRWENKHKRTYSIYAVAPLLSNIISWQHPSHYHEIHGIVLYNIV